MNLLDVEMSVLALAAALLLVYAVRLRHRMQSGEDFILGRRRVHARLAGAGIAMSGIPMWWLLLIAASAYVNGRSAVWVALAMLTGVIVTGWTIAPRLRRRAQMQQCNTISQLLAGDVGEKMHRVLMRSAALIAAIAITLQLASQLQLIADYLAPTIATSRGTAIFGVLFVVCLALLISGFWTALVGEVLQVALWVGVAIVLSVAIYTKHEAAPVWSMGGWFADQSGLLKLSLVVGFAFLIGDAMGQSSLLARFMACKDDAEMLRARQRGLVIAAITTLAALALGWTVRAFAGADSFSIDAATRLASYALSPGVSAILTTLILIGFAFAVSSGLNATAAHFANDVRRGGTTVSLGRCRAALIIAALLSAGLAIYLPNGGARENFGRMLFSWHALGAAFGPLIIVRLTGKRVRPGSMLGAMWSGFLLTIVFHLMPETPGDLLERSLPFTTALGIALSGGERRRNPDRADRGERTIHDRLPI
jgi:sodium/proline symporter